MEQIRRNVFETNSSSTHSITMCPKEEFEKWKKGELFYIDYSGEFVNAEERDKCVRRAILWNKFKTNWKENTVTFKEETVTFDGSWEMQNEIRENWMTEENLAEITQEVIDEALADLDEYNLDRYEIPLSYDEWYDYINFEKYEEEYTTPKGEKIVAFGCYGYEG